MGRFTHLCLFLALVAPLLINATTSYKNSPSKENSPHKTSVKQFKYKPFPSSHVFPTYSSRSNVYPKPYYPRSYTAAKTYPYSTPSGYRAIRKQYPASDYDSGKAYGASKPSVYIPTAPKPYPAPSQYSSQPYQAPEVPVYNSPTVKPYSSPNQYGSDLYEVPKVTDGSPILLGFGYRPPAGKDYSASTVYSSPASLGYDEYSDGDENYKPAYTSQTSPYADPPAAPVYGRATSTYDPATPRGYEGYQGTGYSGDVGTRDHYSGTFQGTSVIPHSQGFTSVGRLQAREELNYDSRLYLSAGDTNYLYVLQNYGMKEDPCKHGVKVFPVWDVCFAYFTCEYDSYGKSAGVKWHDCGVGYSFQAARGTCVQDATCKSACQNAPHIQPTYDPFTFLLGGKVQTCPAGTYFNFRDCTCDHLNKNNY